MEAANQKRTAFCALIRGRVQGVGFRYSAIREAERLGVRGWVRNTAEGAVEVWAEGLQKNLDVFSAWLHKGPPLSRVDSIQKDSVEPGGYADFKAAF
jgi:acylphosphatase